MSSLPDDEDPWAVKAKEAALEVRRDADRGDVEALFQLGIIYETGDGVEEDVDAALHWLQAAGDAGHRSAFGHRAEIIAAIRSNEARAEEGGIFNDQEALREMRDAIEAAGGSGSLAAQAQAIKAKGRLSLGMGERHMRTRYRLAWPPPKDPGDFFSAGSGAADELPPLQPTLHQEEVALPCGRRCFVVRDLLSPKECRHLIAQGEGAGLYSVQVRMTVVLGSFAVTCSGKLQSPSSTHVHAPPFEACYDQPCIVWTNRYF